MSAPVFVSIKMALFFCATSPYNIPPRLNRQTKAHSHFSSALGDVQGECAPPLRTLRLCARDLDHAQALSPRTRTAARAPCALPPSLSPPVPREQVFFGRSRWIHLACTAAPYSCEKWPLSSCRRPSAPAVASPRPLQPQHPLALAPLAGLENAGSHLAGFCLPGCGALSCLAARPWR